MHKIKYFSLKITAYLIFIYEATSTSKTRNVRFFRFQKLDFIKSSSSQNSSNWLSLSTTTYIRYPVIHLWKNKYNHYRSISLSIFFGQSPISKYNTSVGRTFRSHKKKSHMRLFQEKSKHTKFINTESYPPWSIMIYIYSQSNIIFCIPNMLLDRSCYIHIKKQGILQYNSYYLFYKSSFSTHQIFRYLYLITITTRVNDC